MGEDLICYKSVPPIFKEVIECTISVPIAILCKYNRCWCRRQAYYHISLHCFATLYLEKAQDLQLFRECCFILERGGEKSLQGNARVQRIALSMNKTSKRYSKGHKPTLKMRSIPKLHPQYVSGLI